MDTSWEGRLDEIKYVDLKTRLGFIVMTREKLKVQYRVIRNFQFFG